MGRDRRIARTATATAATIATTIPAMTEIGRFPAPDDAPEVTVIARVAEWETVLLLAVTLSV